MTAIPSREVTTAQISAVNFSFYSDEEVRKLSVKEINNPLTLDNLKQPIPGGLYDPALGPLEMFDTCATCGLKYRACPGHFGHIELSVPVYNPLVFGTLYKLLRCVCLHCYKFRMSAMDVAKFKTKMQLISEGRLVEASQISVSASQVTKTSNELLGEQDKDVEDLKFQNGSHSTEESPHRSAKRKRSRTSETVHTIEAARECQLEFFGRIPAACQNCGAYSPAIRKEGASKIFAKALDIKKLLQNKLNGTTVVSALSVEAHGDQEADLIEQQIADQTAQDANLTKAEKKEKKFLEKGAEKDNLSNLVSKESADLKQRYMSPAEIREVMKRFWLKESDVLQFLYANNFQIKDTKQKLLFRPQGLQSLMKTQSFRNAYQMFFVQVVAVPPNNVRPLSRMGEMTFENPQNIAMTQIVNLNLDLVSMNQMDKDIKSKENSGGLGPVGGIDLGRALRLWLNLQNALNGLYDTASTEGNIGGGQGIRQLLEKKEGLFRKNMMGKRVNFACRSVISPDPYLGSGEIGIPPYFAVRLSVPERVTPRNVQELRQRVINGPFKHPGANAVEDENGRMVNLLVMNQTKRDAIAKQLLTKQGTVMSFRGAGQGVAGKIVYRHVQDGDIMLTNRQPTLHKPGLMAHRARVLKGERTIRMHYANCATFNADFDGDEINLHVPQDLLGRSEGYNIVHADHQYIVPTDGKPIRGLIQDHVIAGVMLTKRDTFLSRDEFMQLVYSAICPTRPGLKDHGKIQVPTPAILKPKPLWTGKQVISAVVGRLTEGKAPMTLHSKCKVTEKYWGKDNNEEMLIFQSGDLVTGVMDKAQYGKFGMVHGVQELYGSVTAGNLLSVFSRLWTHYLQANGFTCGIGDLLLKNSAETSRSELIKDVERRATCASAEYAGVPFKNIENPDTTKASDIAKKQVEVESALGEKYRSNKMTGAVHDRKVIGSVQPISSEVVDICLPNGQVKPFPVNCLSLMTVTGAKGSQVNFSQISCLLGQQELEGRRVPRMASGKTLPCFGAYEGGARSGGYISDRFLTGLRPQEYYFHCMAGREGLVDTTVKTSRSGYLQRCLVKNLENLRTSYDGTVRDSSDGSVVQFQYGEDGIDVLNCSFLNEHGFLLRNMDRLKEQEIPGSQSEVQAVSSLTEEEQKIAKENRWRQRQLAKKERGKKAEDVNSKMPISGLHFATRVGATSENFQDKLGLYLRQEKGEFGHTKGTKRKQEEGKKSGSKEDSEGSDKSYEFRRLMDLRYMRALANPGEAVGVIAAQSVGEPSTQMTLNTFHMAGRGEANVTLGIPRLRELFMTASKSIKTPVMTMPLNLGKTRDDAEVLVNHLRRIKLAEVLEDISIEEEICNHVDGSIVRKYTIHLKCIPESRLPPKAEITFEKISECFRLDFMRQLKAAAKKELTAFERNAKIHTMVDEEKPVLQQANENGDLQPTKRKRKDDDDENAEDNDEFDEGKLRFAGGRSEKGAMYDVGDEEDKEIAKKQEKDAQKRDEMPDDEQDVKDEPREDEPSTPTGDRNVTEDGKIDDKTRTCSASISIPLAAPKLLMLGIVENIAAKVLVRHTQGIEKCYIIDGQKDPKHPEIEPPPTIQTDGISFEGAWSNDDVLDVNKLTTNDVGSVLSTYGVEAARATLMREVSSVFGAYGIAVDPRHLGLIADFMTHQGGYRACSRLGIENNRSTFLKITFETASHFLTDATLRGVSDDLSSPASRIILGRVVELGTGTFALRQKLNDEKW